MTETLTGAQILCRSLVEAGVEVIFGYPWRSPARCLAP